MNTKAQLLTLLLALLGIAQCSGENNLSSKVTFRSRHDQPIVVKGDLTIGSGDSRITIKAPWFGWQYYFRNDTDKRLMVSTVAFKVVSRKNGIRKTKEYYIDPNRFCAAGSTRSFLAIVDPADDLSTTDEFTGVRNCDITNRLSWLTPPDFEDWYIDSLDESDSAYSVDVEAIGWFEDPNNGEIIERYSGFDFLVTQ